MAFALPSDLPTNWVDNSSTIHASDWNNTAAMGNALKAAIATMGYGTQRASVATSETTTTSASYTDLTTTTDQVTVGIGSSGKALVFFGSQVANSGAGGYGYVAVDVSGANTIAASDANAIQLCANANNSAKQHSNAILFTELTAGVTTFKLKYKVSAGTGTFANRRIAVIPLSATDGTHTSATFNLDASSAVALSMSGYGNGARFSSLGNGTTSSTARSSMSWSHTATEGDTVLAFVETNNGEYVTTATYGGTAMQKVFSANTPDDTYTITVLSLVNVAGGASTVSIQKNSATHSMQGNTVGYSNVKNIKTIGSTNGVGTTAGMSVSPALGDLAAVGMVTYYGAAYTSTAGGTNRWNDAGAVAQAISDTMGPATLTATQPGDTRNWVATQVVLTPDTSLSAAFNLAVTPSISMGGQGVRYDATGAGAYGNGVAAGTYTETHVLGADATAIVVAAMIGCGANATITAKIGSTDMTQIYQRWVYSNTWQLVVFGMVNPPTGSQTISILGASGTTSYSVNSVSYKGVKSFGEPESPAAGTASPATQTIDVETYGGMFFNAIGCAYNSDPALTSYSQTQRARVASGTNAGLLIGDSPDNGSTTFSATVTNTGTYKWGSIAVPLVPIVQSASFDVSVAPSISMTGGGVKPAIQGANAANSSAVTIPAHQAGDLIVIFARNSSGTAPSIPSAGGTVPTFTNIQGAGGTYSSVRMGYAIATSNDHTSGSWSGANGTIAVVLRGAHPDTPVGGKGISAESATANTCPGAAITLSNSTGSSQILEFYGYGDGINAFTSVSSAPSGHTRQVTGNYSGNKVGIACNVRDTTTSGAAVAQAATSSCWSRGAAVEILSNAQ